MTRVAAVVLAAGAGRRFGAVKQLATLDGRPLLEHAVRTACSMPELDRVLLVLGAHADTVEPALDLGRAEVVRCERWMDGPQASLRCAAKVLAADPPDALVVLLGDQPRVRADAIARTLATPGAAVRATYGRRPGHPVVLRGEPLATLLGAGADVRGRVLAAGAVEVAVDDEASGMDVDTAADLRVLAAAGTGERRRTEAGT